MKRILCLLSNMNAGGAETFLMKLYRELDKNKYQMDFCINVPEKCFYEDEILSMGGRMFRIPARTTNYKRHNKELYSVISENKYKYVLAVSASATSFIDLKIAKKAGAEICSIRSSNSKGPGGIKAKIVQNICKMVFSKYADVKIAPSDLAAEFLFGKKSIEKNDVFFLHNALDLKKYSFQISEREKIRRQYNIADDAFVVGHVGRFYPQKNHAFLIDVFQQIHLMKSNSYLFLVGNGQLMDDVKNKVAEIGLENNVIFLGERSDVPSIMCAIDVFVFPSFFEGMPNTVIEAQAIGVPCYISDAITREAKIIDKVTYISLNDNAEKWARCIMSKDNTPDRNTYEMFKNAKYDIGSCTNEFVKYTFGEI